MRFIHLTSYWPNAPLTIWLVGLALLIGLATGQSANAFLNVFNIGFGRALGDFALILLPSFVMAAAMALQKTQNTGQAARVSAPFVGAGMVCPDTAYASLSSIAGQHKLSVSLGAYAGFKLLLPAGPLIVATGLGVEIDGLMLYGMFVFLPVWIAGELWVRSMELDNTQGPTAVSKPDSNLLIRLFSPFALMALLLLLGHFVDASGHVLADYLTRPKGALMVAAVLALAMMPAKDRRECMDSSLRRTGALLLVIGMASAFGAVLIEAGLLHYLTLTGSGFAGLIALFLITAVFKLIQGSSMATFAAVTPVAAAFLTTTDIPSAAAVMAICAGSFVAILPNDSFYWLVRRDALAESGEWHCIKVLAGGALLQALVAMAAVLVAFQFGIGT